MSEALAAARDRLARGDVEGAVAGLAGALRADPDRAELWCLLGQIYLGLPQPADALACFERALALAPGDEAGTHGLAAAAQALGTPERALAGYRQALAAAPLSAGLRLGLAASLLEAGQAETAWDEARQVVEREPSHAAGWRVCGDAAMALERPRDAVAAYRRAVALVPEEADGHHALALALLDAGQDEDALAAFLRALEIDPGHGAALAQACHLQRRLCHWVGLSGRVESLRAAVAAGRPGITPFSFLAECGDPADQLACARLWAKQVEREAASLAAQLGPFRPSVPAGDRIRVGFVSSGFNNHPTALLIAELIERLHESGLRTVGFATTADDGGVMRQRLRLAFHEFEEVDGLDLAALAGRLRRAGLDVVFDLRGYGEGAVSPVYAARVAPVQVNWLAYPGTQGARFMDYLLADRYVVPVAERYHYCEALVRLPHCFQPSDGTRRIPQPPSRTACGLPEHAPVLASFNNSYKIGPEVFDAWTAILRAVPDAVLWLLRTGPPAMVGNLRCEAAKRGVDPARLMFMEKLPHPEYLARYHHVDLFLDTWPYNAHTTASDALFAGCPVLTLPGRAFAARVAGSLLHTLGLRTLIADDVQDYVARAVALARDPQARQRLRTELDAARRGSPLFDMRRFAADFAAAVSWMAGRQRQGLSPADHDLASEHEP